MYLKFLTPFPQLELKISDPYCFIVWISWPHLCSRRGRHLKFLNPFAHLELKFLTPVALQSGNPDPICALSEVSDPNPDSFCVGVQFRLLILLVSFSSKYSLIADNTILHFSSKVRNSDHFNDDATFFLSLQKRHQWAACKPKETA